METKNYCRLCLGKSANLLWVFDQRFEVNNHLKDLILKTTGVKISQEDTISQKICHKCGENVVKLYEFRQQSIKNDQFLKDQQKAQKRKPHRSILNIFQKYPRILIPDLEICLSEDISPVVVMRMDEVENHFKSKNLDFQKHVVQVLRQERQKQRAINAALKSKNPINTSNETVSPISIKFRQDKSVYEIVNKNDDEEPTHSNNSLNHLGNHRKRQLSDCEQSCSSKRSPIDNSSSVLTPIPNRRQSIGPIEFNIRPGPSDLDATLLEALEVSENQNVSLTSTKRSPEIISNILIRPAVSDTSNNKTNTAINSSTLNHVTRSTSCDDNYLRINNTYNAIEDIHPKPGVIDHLNFLKKSLNAERSCSNINPVESYPTHHRINESLVPYVIPLRPPILPKDNVQQSIPDPNFLPQTIIRPGQHTNVNLVQNIPVKPQVGQQSIPNPNFLPQTVIRPGQHTNVNLGQNIIPVKPQVGQQYIPNPNVLPQPVNRPHQHTNVNLVQNIPVKPQVDQQSIPNPNYLYQTVTRPSLPIVNSVQNSIPVKPNVLPNSTIIKQSIPHSNVFPPTGIRPQHHTNENSLPKRTMVQQFIPNSNSFPPFVTRPSLIVPNTNTIKPRLVPMNNVAQQFIPNQSLRYPMANRLSTVLDIANRCSKSIGVNTEIVSNLDKNDKPLHLQTAPDISLKPNAIPEQCVKTTSKPVDTTPKFEPEFTCNFCQESFATVQIRQEHLGTCRIKKEVERPVYVLLENIEHNVDIKKQYHKVFNELAERNSNVIEILDEPIKIENLVLNLTPQVEIKNSNFPNINYTSNTTDVLKKLLAYDKNESPVNQNSQTDLSSESPELDNVISNLKMFPKKDSIHPQGNTVSMNHLKSFIHMYKIPVSIDYRKSIQVNYNFEEPPKRRKEFDDWDDLTPIDVVKAPTIVRKQSSTPIAKDVLVTPVSVPNPGEALVIPIENICQNVSANPSTSQNILPNLTVDGNINQLRDSVITNASSNVAATETLPDLGDLELFANDLLCAETLSPSGDSGIFESTTSSHSNELLLNNPQTNYVVQPQQNAVYQQMVTHVQPNVINTGNCQSNVYHPAAAGERINGLETNYFANYMNYQQHQMYRSNKTWYPPPPPQQNPAVYKDVRAPPPSYNSPHQRIPPGPQKRQFHNALPHPYNHINNNYQIPNNYYPYEQQNSNQNVNRSNYYNRNFVPDVSNVPENVNYNYHVTDNNYKCGAQIDSAIMQTSDIANSASTIRVRPLSDLK